MVGKDFELCIKEWIIGKTLHVNKIELVYFILSNERVENLLQ